MLSASKITTARCGGGEERNSARRAIGSREFPAGNVSGLQAPLARVQTVRPRIMATRGPMISKVSEVHIDVGDPAGRAA